MSTHGAAPGSDADLHAIAKLPTYVTGLDHVTGGGFPRGRTTLVAGTSGSAKTVLATQFLVGGIRQAGEAGVFVTFEESPDDIRRNVAGFGWSLAEHEAAGQLRFVDASPDPTDREVVVGDFDFGALIARVEHAVRAVGATRLTIDSVGTVFGRFGDTARVRRELHRLLAATRELGVTTLVTAERTDEYGGVARHGVEEFVADNVVILRNALETQRRRRTVEVLKFRGADHRKGEYPFSVNPSLGVVVIPLSAMHLDQPSSSERITSGSADLDTMCGGGFFRDSVVLVSGATGTGKTLTSTGFMASGAAAGERCLLFGFEESRDQLVRNARSWGVDLEALEGSGALRVVCAYPEADTLEDHLVDIKAQIDEFRPDRIAIDSLSALERIGSEQGFREFIIGLTAFIKEQGVAGLYTATTSDLFGATSVTGAHVSTITDAIILLRYVEVAGEMRRAITVLKMRGSAHDKSIRQFTIDDTGLQIGVPFGDVTGVIGAPPRPGGDGALQRGSW